MTINKTTQYITNPDIIPIVTSIGEQALVDAINQRIVYVDTISDLKALSTGALVDGQQVQIKEYHAGTGVGGGEFYWDSGSAEPDNGGTVIEVSGVPVGRWKRRTSGALSVCDFGAAPGSSSDASTAINSALASGASVIYQPEGVYQASSNVILNRSVEWHAEGAAVEFSTGQSLQVEGGIEELGAIFLSAASSGDQEIELDHAGAISAGDVLMLFNTNDSSYSKYRASYKDGEAVTVISVSGNTIGLNASLETDYLADASHTVSILNCISPNIHGLSVNSDSSVSFKYTADSEFKNLLVNIEGDASYGIISQFSYNDTFTTCRVNNTDVTANGYGIALIGAWYTTLNKCYAYSRRHALTIGSGGVTPVNRHLRFNECIFKSYDNANNTHAADLHGIVDDAIFSNCTAFGGVVLGGSNSAWRGGKIISNLAQGPMFIREVAYGFLEYSGADVINHSTFPDFGAHSSAEHDDPVGDIYYVLDNLRLRRTDGTNSREIAGLPFGEVSGLTLSLKMCDIEYDYQTSAYVAGFSASGVTNTKVGSLYISRMRGPNPDGNHFNNGVLDRFDVGESKITLPTQVQKVTVTVPVGGTGSSGPVFPLRYNEFPYIQLICSIVGTYSGSNLQVEAKGLTADANGDYYFSTVYVSDNDSSLGSSTDIDVVVSAVVEDMVYFG